VIVFEEPDASVIEKLENRPIDRNSGAFCDSSDSEYEGGDKKPRANPRKCKIIVDEYRQFLSSAIQAYDAQMIRINATADPEQIYLNFQDALQS
jgi:hypothetical protein